ncbi:MAG: ribosome silencing factor [Thermodesulfobacteriota bacterium]|nr:ribosome silencing factor [Thermodesulfobacteriota bacterium]
MTDKDGTDKDGTDKDGTDKDGTNKNGTDKDGQIENIEKYIKAALSRKAENIIAIDVRELTSYADAIIIITGRSGRQVTSIAEHIQITMKKEKKPPIGFEGVKLGTWALLDFGDVIIHVFDKKTRELYDIEGLWSDAPRIDLSKF